MLALAPGLVRMDRAAPGHPEVPPDCGRSELSMDQAMDPGVFGDPTRATAEKGRRRLALGAQRSADPWLRAAGKPAKLALIAAMRKLLNAVYSVAGNRKPFVTLTDMAQAAQVTRADAACAMSGRK